MEFLYGNLLQLDVRMIVMWAIGGLLIYLAIKKDMEPSLLLPMGFGAILVNLPNSGAVTQGAEEGVLDVLYNAGIANELFPLLLFVGIGAMIDFGPLLENPKLLIFGAASQFGIFFTLSLASLCGFSLHDAASIAVIGAADGPTAIFVSQWYASQYMGAIMVAAYSYMALVPIIQPPVIKLLTTKKERTIHMAYTQGQVSKTTRILFPIVVTILAGLVAPRSVALVAPQTLMILGLGLVAFIFDTAGGVLFAKFMNLFLKKKINPMIGACGISAFPMSSRVVAKMALAEDKGNFLLMQAAGVNVGGQVASVIAGGLILNLIAR